MRKIAFEEHFFTQDYIDYLRSRKEIPRREITEDEKHHQIEQIWYAPSCCMTLPTFDVTGGPIADTADGRLREMDKAGISMQVLSLGLPGIEAFDAADAKLWAKSINDELARIVNRHPQRFVGLAALPLQEPDAAVVELERAVKELRLVGAMIYSHIGGEYLDNKKYWSVFEKAEKLGVPLFLHARVPSPDMVKPFLEYPLLWAALWGFGADAGIHAMRLICSGVFDQFPRLKIIMGHLGEGLPFWMWRLDRIWQITPMSAKLRRKPSEYLKSNFAVTTSGMFSVPTLVYVCQMLGADNILFAVDYPHESNELAVQFMEAAPIADADKAKIYHLNAERLLALPG